MTRFSQPRVKTGAQDSAFIANIKSQHQNFATQQDRYFNANTEHSSVLGGQSLFSAQNQQRGSKLSPRAVSQFDRSTGVDGLTGPSGNL